jgi:hypothetical protein
MKAPPTTWKHVHTPSLVYLDAVDNGQLELQGKLGRNDSGDNEQTIDDKIEAVLVTLNTYSRRCEVG